MIHQIYLVLTGVVAVITFVFGILFLFMTIPGNKLYDNYRVCRKLLAIAYLIMFGLNLVELFMSKADNDPFITHYITLIISSFQSFLFTYALITLINTEYLTPRRIFTELVPIGLLTIGCSLSFLLHLPVEVEYGIFVVGIGYYSYQLIRYTLMFNRQFQQYERNFNNFFSENESNRMHWVRFAFYLALSAGIMALSSEFITIPIASIIFVLVFAFFYLFFGIRYLNYVYVFNTIEPVTHVVTDGIVESRLTNEELARAVESWVQLKRFLQPGLTLNDLTIELNTNRTYLSNYINQNKGMNFNAWINWLRIEEAKDRLVHQPEMSIAEISEQVGYSEHSNFSRYFLKYTGTTPSVWRKDCPKSKR